MDHSNHHTCTPSKNSSLEELAKLSQRRVNMAAKMANSPAGQLNAPGRLYVGNLPDRFTSEDLEIEFSRYGVIIDCHVHGREYPTKSNSHYGYITFDRETAASVALKKMRGRVIARRGQRPVGPLRVALVSEGPLPLSSPTTSISPSSSTSSNSPSSFTSPTSPTFPTSPTSPTSLISDSTSTPEILLSDPLDVQKQQNKLNIDVHHSHPGISPLAFVDPGAVIGQGCTVGPFTHILSTAIIGIGTSISSHCMIGGVLGTWNTVGPYTLITQDVLIGNQNEFVSHVAIGNRAEDYVQPKNKPTGKVEIGNCNVFREFVTIHAPEGERGGELDGTTKIGDACYLMRGSHVGHDNVLGDRVTLACNTCLAGYVRVGIKANLGIGTVVHQFTTIGRDTIIGMGSSVLTDIPPYVMFTSRSGSGSSGGGSKGDNTFQGDANPGRIEQLNVIGMMRAGIKDEWIDNLEIWYRENYCPAKIDCFLKCDATNDWFTQDMMEYHRERAKQNRRRPLTQVASGTPLES